MPRETKKEIFDKYKGRISESKKFIEQAEKEWETSQRLYEVTGYNDAASQNGNDKNATINIGTIYSTFSVVLASIFPTLPSVIARAERPEDLEFSDVVEKIIDSSVQKSGLYEDIFQSCFSAILFRIGYCKLGFAEIGRRVNKDDAVIWDAFIEEFPEGTEKDYEEFKRNPNNVTDEIVDEQGIWTENIHPKDIFLDPNGRDVESCAWIMHRMYLTERQIKDMLGRNVSIVGAEENAVNHEIGEDTSKIKDVNKRYEIIEIWSKEDDKRYVLISGQDKFIVDEEWPNDMNGYPLESLSISPRYNTPYGNNLIMISSALDGIINRMTTKQVSNAERAKSGFFHEKGALDGPQAEALTSAEGSFLNEVNDINGITSFQTTPPPNEIFDMKKDSIEGVEQISGVSALRRQVRSPSKRTATEVSEQAESADVSQFFITRRIERYYERLIRKTIALSKQYMTKPQLLRIDTRMQGTKFVEWSGKDIGEYTYNVKAGSAAIKNDAINLQQSMQGIKLTGDLASQGQIPNPGPILEELYMKAMEALDANTETVREAFKPQQQQIAAPISGLGVSGQAATGGPAPGGPPQNKLKTPTQQGVSLLPRPSKTPPP